MTQTRFSRLLLIVALALPLGACMSAAEQARQMREIEASDDAACRNAGMKPRTPAYAKCRENMSSQRQMAARIGLQNQIWSMEEMNRQQMFRPPM